jgi:hypothetical protein
MTEAAGCNYLLFPAFFHLLLITINLFLQDKEGVNEISFLLLENFENKMNH